MRTTCASSSFPTRDTSWSMPRLSSSASGLSNSSEPARTSPMRRRLRAAANPAYLVLLALLVVGFVLRVKNNDYGLPYVYNVDEGSHFTARAVSMLGGDWNPHYFQNPSAFTYLAHFALAARFGHRAIDEFKLDPTGIYVTSRTVAAMLCMLGVVAVFWAGRRLWGTGAAVAS